MTIPIEIFRAGRHTAMNGETIVFSDSDLDQIAKSYNPKVHEAPVVIGHPAHNAPAYGWAKSLSSQAGVLRADVDQVDPSFAESVKRGAWKKVSASFYKPGSANNPTPGSYYLRHIGFLGAQPPAVKGLREASFAGGDDDCVTLEFGDLDVANLLRSLREFLIAEFGQEKADKALPPWDVTYAQNAAAVEQANENPSYAEADDVAAAALKVLTDAMAQLATDVTTALVEGTVASLVAALPDVPAETIKAALEKAWGPGEGEQATGPVQVALKTALDKLSEPMTAAVKAALPAATEADPAPADLSDPAPPHAPSPELERLKRENAALKEREAKARRDGHASFLDGIAREGRRLPAKRGLVLELLELAAGSEASFADGADKATPLELVKRLLSRLPKEVDFSERGGVDEFGDDADPIVVARAARQYQDEQAAKGVSVTTAEAVNHVKGKR